MQNQPKKTTSRPSSSQSVRSTTSDDSTTGKVKPAFKSVPRVSTSSALATSATRPSVVRLSRDNSPAKPSMDGQSRGSSPAKAARSVSPKADIEFEKDSFSKFQSLFHHKFGHNDGRPFFAMVLWLNKFHKENVHTRFARTRVDIPDKRCELILEKYAERHAQGVESVVVDKATTFYRIVQDFTDAFPKVSFLDIDFIKRIQRSFQAQLNRHPMLVKDGNSYRLKYGNYTSTEFADLEEFVVKQMITSKFGQGSTKKYISSTRNLTPIGLQLINLATTDNRPATQELKNLIKSTNKVSQKAITLFTYRVLSEIATLLKDGSKQFYVFNKSSPLGIIASKLENGHKYIVDEGENLLIPYGNVGTLISELFPLKKKDETVWDLVGEEDDCEKCAVSCLVMDLESDLIGKSRARK